MCQDRNEVISYYRYINIPGQVQVRLVIKIDTGIEEILLLSIGFNLEMRRLSRISRSNLELPDVSIVKSESEMVCLER